MPAASLWPPNLRLLISAATISDAPPVITALGAGCFGCVVGWVAHRCLWHRGQPHIRDLATLIAIIAGASITALFPSQSIAFSGYCIGLFIGFFAHRLTRQFKSVGECVGSGSGLLDLTREEEDDDDEGVGVFTVQESPNDAQPLAREKPGATSPEDTSLGIRVVGTFSDSNR